MPVWDIAARPAHEQFEFWHDVICAAFVPLTPTRTTDRAGFAARVETRELGAINRAGIRSQPQLTAHGPREVSRSEPYYFVNLQLAGRCAVRQGAAESVLLPGELTVVDTTEPYYFDFDTEWRMLSFRIPHRLLDLRLPDPRQGTGRRFPGGTGLGAVVTALMRSLWELDGPLDSAAEAELEQSFAAVLAAVMGAVPDDPPSVRAATRAAVLRHVLADLTDPGLSVTSVCRRFAISPRMLHALFEGSGRSFAETVRTLRLERCARLLADPATTASVTEIGARHGYPDPASFSRAFRRHFGVAPRDVRAGAGQAVPRKVAEGS